MPSPTVVATAGASNANSYLTVAEAQSYFDTRVSDSVIGAWENADDKSALVIQGTRTIESLLSPMRKLVRATKACDSYYRTGPTWTGTIASDTQSLMVPRVGLYTRTGVLIASSVVPNELKWAVAELSARLALSDLTLDNDIAIQGITSVKAGSVSVSFRDGSIDVMKGLPDFILSLLVPSWVTDELIEPAYPAIFDVIS